MASDRSPDPPPAEPPALPGPRLRGIAPRLILFLGVPLAAAGVAFGIASARIQEDQLLDKVVQGTAQLSSSVVSATWHAMRADRRADAYETMETMGRRNGIERIRLFDNQGRIAFSTDPEEAGRRAGKDSETCSVCHNGGAPVARMEEPRRSRTYAGPDGRRRLGIVTAIYNEPACSQAACHAHPADQSVVGVLDVTVDLGPVDGEIAGIQRRTLLLTLVHLGIVAAVILACTHVLVARPVRRLIEGTQSIAAMDLDRPVATDSDTEIGEMARAVERMRLRLRDAVREIEEARRGLEATVEERGRLLRDAERKLVQSDRLASLGRLAGVVAHEINNPISAVHTFSVAMQRVLRPEGIPRERVEEFRGYLDQVARETARVGRIVADLLTFSRRASPQFARADCNAVVERTVALVRHKLELSRAEARLDLDPALPPLLCDASQLEQVFLNLLLNAAESMPQGGLVRVRTRLAPGGDAATFEVEDEGVGIPEEHLPRIFEPFFTTKGPARGVGLGLAVAYGIVQAHGGEVDVRSAPGKGTTFVVRLPLRGKEAAP